MTIISTRSLTKPLDFLFRNKPSPPISQLSNFFCDTSKLLRWPQLGHRTLIGPAVLAHDGRVSTTSSTNEEKGNVKCSARIFSSMPAAFGASFALACVLAIFYFGSTLMLSPRRAVAAPMTRTASPGRTEPQQDITTSVISAQLALRLFMEGVVHLGSSKFNILPRPSIYRVDVAELRAEALELMKKGRPVQALDKMEQNRKKYNDEGSEGKYHFEMALVEILILQGKYNDALKCKCLEETKPTDIRRALYKAIIYTILDDKEKATASWKEFASGGFDGVPNPT
ncbi:hypothetical protein TIFTF001_012463 [Ficus carica]|uniref:Uncharacterized protein n=1 Tax=Ficus carica TaxID=3494 RepID=A0AA87ZTF8_FICCA|nr:hypothetical protein TIFTF001_012463 [Ficus carica]